MANVRIGSMNAARVSGVLRKLGSDQAVPSDLRANATFWSRGMARRMDRRDLQTVAWLLLHASAERRLPFTRRRTARYWATFLESRM